MRFPLLGKAAGLVAVGVGLAWGLGMVGGVVAEREGRLHEAQRGVAASLASEQTLVGPVMQRSCVETWESTQGEGKDRKTIAERREFTLLRAPSVLQADARASLEPRYRGLYKVNGYLAKSTLKATWNDTAWAMPSPQQPHASVRCEAPVLAVGIGDARGIRNAQLSVGGVAQTLEAGSVLPNLPRGFHARLDPAVLNAGTLSAEVALEVVGTETLAFAPIADATTVHLASDWPHPSFAGRFLPSQRTVTDKGFDATWQLSTLASSAQQELLSGAATCALGDSPEEAMARNAPENGSAKRAGCVETFGVGFIDPVNPYVLSDRATKYGLLFIGLTFVAVLLVEVMRRLRVHPIQYLLVGSALTVFFLLLVSLTEHIAFEWAYLAASAACTLLLGFYGAYVLRGRLAGLAFGAGIGLLYGALYLLLQMEQNSLVLGAGLLFAVLAAVMVVTRKVDWYGLMAQLRLERAPDPVPDQG
jgi:inner membrane protein